MIKIISKAASQKSRYYRDFFIRKESGEDVPVPSGPFDSDQDLVDWLVEAELAEVEEQ